MDNKKVKEFWDKMPCNINHSKKTFLSKEYFDEIEQKKYYVEPHIPQFAEFPKWNGKNVLELGCGIGTDSINFFRNGANLTVIDISSKSLNICKERFKVDQCKKEGKNTIEFYEGDIEKLSEIIPLKKYDLIYSFGVIHHTSTPENVFKQLQYFMDSNTELRIMLYSRVSFKLFQMMFEENYENRDPEKKDDEKKDDKNPLIMKDAENIIRKNAEKQYNCSYAYTYTFKEIKELLKRNNLQLFDICKKHIFKYDISHYINNQYKINKYWAGVSDEMMSIYEDELGFHTLIKAKLRCE